jgi:hypothetical protein
MRRLALIVVAISALAAPAAALALKTSPGDGSLVVTNGTAPSGLPVVVMKVTGSIIGQVVGDQGRIVIDSGANGPTPEVSGTVGPPHPVATDPDGTSQVWNGGPNGFKFRAVNGTFTILIYGSQVNFVALGKGWAKVAGSPDTPKSDGRYSLNGSIFRSLPSDQTDKLYLLSNG